VPRRRLHYDASGIIAYDEFFEIHKDERICFRP
jgi:hypothetical protein